MEEECACHMVVDGVEVEEVQTVKYLGVMFSEG